MRIITSVGKNRKKEHRARNTQAISVKEALYLAQFCDFIPHFIIILSTHGYFLTDAHENRPFIIS